MRVAGVAAIVAGGLLIYFVFSAPKSAAAGSPGNTIVPNPTGSGGGFDPTIPAQPVGTGTAPGAISDVAAAQLAQSQVGKRYSWGATTDPTLGTLVYDCSSLVQSVFEHIGRTLPRTSQQQAQVTTPIGANELRLGDLVFGSFSSPNDHVGIYVGGGQVVSALDEARGVVQSAIANWPGVHFGRV